MTLRGPVLFMELNQNRLNKKPIFNLNSENKTPFLNGDLWDPARLGGSVGDLANCLAKSGILVRSSCRTA